MVTIFWLLLTYSSASFYWENGKRQKQVGTQRNFAKKQPGSKSVCLNLW